MGVSRREGVRMSAVGTCNDRARAVCRKTWRSCLATASRPFMQKHETPQNKTDQRGSSGRYNVQPSDRARIHAFAQNGIAAAVRTGASMLRCMRTSLLYCAAAWLSSAARSSSMRCSARSRFTIFAINARASPKWYPPLLATDNRNENADADGRW